MQWPDFFSKNQTFPAKAVRLMKRALPCTWRGKSMNIIFCNRTFWLWSVTYHLHVGLVFFAHQLRLCLVVSALLNKESEMCNLLILMSRLNWHSRQGVTQTLTENILYIAALCRRPRRVVFGPRSMQRSRIYAASPSTNLQCEQKCQCSILWIWLNPFNMLPSGKLT